MVPGEQVSTTPGRPITPLGMATSHTWPSMHSGRAESPSQPDTHQVQRDKAVWNLGNRTSGEPPDQKRKSQLNLPVYNQKGKLET